MSDVTTIGRAAHVRGKVSGASDLEIFGRVDGDVAIDGEVTIDATGIVGANVSARRLVVRGAVRGDLTASEAVLLESGARVAGDVRAPRVSIAVGALVRGYVQTGGAGEGSRASSARASRSNVAIKSAPAATKSPASIATTVRTPQAVPARVAPAPVTAVRKGAPAPVVPVLKKGAKGQLNKKRAG